MAKAKNKNTTIDDIAVMVNTGFDNQMEYMAKTFTTKDDLKKTEERLEKKMEGLATRDDVKKLSKQMEILHEDFKRNDKVEMRLAYVENVLAIKKN
jgi:hypothetical protein